MSSSDIDSISDCNLNKITKTNKKNKKKIQIDLNVNDKINKELHSQNIYVFNCDCKKSNNHNNNYNQTIYCNCFNQIKNNDYIGINSVSSNFYDCALLLIDNCLTSSMAIHIKSFNLSGIYSVRLYINDQPTQFITTILNGSINLYAINTYQIELKQYDLIAFRLEVNNDNILTKGINVTLSFEK